MSKEKTIGINQNPIQTTVKKYSAWNPFAKKPFINCFGVEIKDDEYYINEIIGIDELPYEEFIKEDEDKKPPVQLEFDFSGKDNFNYDE